MIPNIIHFMYFTGPNSREFSYLNYLSVKTAHKVQRPEKIYFYYNQEPLNNKNWDAMKPYVTMVKIDPPNEYMGIALNYPQYQADVVRLQKLIEHGGIYLDTDILLLKPLTDLMDRHCVLGAESYVDHVADLHTTDLNKIGSVSNAVILAEPNSRFINLWLEELPRGFKNNVWAYHAVVLPLELYKQDPSLFDLLEVEAFIPFDFRDYYIFGNDFSNVERLKSSYAVHMWDNIWKAENIQIDVQYMSTVNNLFTYYFK